MNRATRITASTLGIYAGLLGIQHGYFESLQGNIVPNNIMVNAIGAPCQPDAVWHACFPALTLLPNLFVTGMAAILVGLIVLIWSVGFVQRKYGGLILILLSVFLIPIGGGFIPASIGIFAGIAGTKNNSPLDWWRERPSFVLLTLSKLWPWNIIIQVLWLPGGWILGHFFNQTMLNLSMVSFFTFDFFLPLVIVFSSFSFDIQHHKM